MIAGEGLGGIVGAVLQVAKVSGNYYGTAIGFVTSFRLSRMYPISIDLHRCPAMEYCG